MMNMYFSFESKKKLLEKIHTIKTIAYLKQIKAIIKQHNPNIYMMKNNNGIFMNFNGLNEKTYVALENYVSEIFNGQANGL